MPNQWADPAATLLGCTTESVVQRGARESFVALGGTSLQAAELVAIAERDLGLTADLAGLLGPEPFARVVAAATPYRQAAAPAAAPGLKPLLPEHEDLLAIDEMFGGTPNHLLFTAAAGGALDESALLSTLDALTRRHEALRTVFVRDGEARWRRVLPHWRPRLIVQRLTPAAGENPVDVVHAQLAGATPYLLDPYEQPPVVFAWTRVAGRGDLLSLLFHHSAMDGWAVGLLWRELAAVYAAGGSATPEPGPSLDAAAARNELLAASGKLAHLAETRAAQLADLRDVLRLPSEQPRPSTPDTRGIRLRFGIGAAARDGAVELARRAGVTRTAVLLTAWALVLARRGGGTDFTLGLAAAGRPTRELHDIIAMFSRVVPVRPSLDGDASTLECVRRTAARMAEAVAAADVPFGELVARIGATPAFESLPFPRFFFAAHDDLVPETVSAGPVTFTLHEGHCGGSFFDATLFVQHWGASPRFALEYKPSVISAAQAAGLAEAFEQTLIDLSRRTGSPLRTVRGMSAGQLRTLEQLREGSRASTAPGPWQLIEARCAERGSAPAVSATDARLSYAELLGAVQVHAAALSAAGVGIGDRVVVAVPRGAAEIVAVLAIARLGATYVAMDASAPERYLRQVLGQTAPKAVIGEMPDVAGCAAVPPWTPGAVGGAIPAPAPPDPERIAYIAFTSGSTGTPKGVMVPNRGIVRLVHEADYLRVDPGERFLRLAPLAFDASTFEIFAPLIAGGIVEVFPAGPVSPSPLADFLLERAIDIVFLTAGLFRLQVDHRPDGFTTARHVLTGGDVVPPAQVRALLTRYPGLTITNAYGPTENTSITTVHAVGDPCQVGDRLPIGNPIPGTSVLVLGDDGMPVPPGGAGELYTGGLGLAAGYLGLETETAQRFEHRAPGTGERLYRTGDLVRWDDRGRLLFLGRRDGQVKVAGFRVELEGIATCLRAHPAVRDAAVVTAGADAASRRLVAGVIADAAPGLVAELKRWAGERLPDHSVPPLWAVVASLPVTPNGKVDAAALEAIAIEQAMLPVATA